MNKNDANILPKTSLKSTPKLGSILDPTWHHFGRVLGAKMGPSWHQIASKINLQNDQKMITFWIASKSIFGRFWSQNGPQMGVTNVYILEHFGLLGVSWAQDGPKTPPRRPPAPILDDFDPQLGRFWSPTWWILGLNLMDVGTQQPSNPSTIQPKSP